MTTNEYSGRIIEGAIVLEGNPALPEGAAVEVRVIPATVARPLTKKAATNLHKLTELLISELRSERITAAEALGELGDVAATESLLEAMGDRAEEVRKAAERSLLKLGRPALSHLIPALVINDRLRAASERVIGQIDPDWRRSDSARASIPAIGTALKNTGSFYHDREVAARLLGDIGDPAGVTALVAALRDESRFVRIRAAEALGKIGEVRAVKPLFNCLNDQEPGVHEAVAAALGKFGTEALDLLLEALEHRDTMVRRGAIEALRQLADARALEPLLPLLQDEDARVREAAAQAIDPIADARAVEPLLRSLTDESRFVRAHAAQTLGRIGDTRAVAPLTALLADDAGLLRRAAATLLGGFADPTTLMPLLTRMAMDAEMAEECLVAGQRILELHRDQIATVNLQAIARMADVEASAAGVDRMGLPGRRRLNGEALRALAREEIKRRGQKV